jgi:3-hydroxyacyl-CoA dehydrogenase / enoyl-CoA hydratase / 3-hydroxybutyryl-CoA epimerase
VEIADRMATQETAAPAGAALEQRDDGIFVLTLHGKGSKPFILNDAALSELEQVVDRVARAPGARGLIIRSSHPTTFCAGADIETLRSLETPSAIRAAARRGQDLFCRIEDLPYPTAALVHGTCVGGGLELALACTWRLASDHASTRLGLPEVQLGILPAWGGTTRLPMLVGLRAALPMLLQGRTLDGKAALGVGLADECVPQSELLHDAVRLVTEYHHGKEHGHVPQRKTPPLGFADYFIGKFDGSARVFLKGARRRVLAETRGHYPAPLEIIRVLDAGIGQPRWGKLDLEREAVVKLLTSPVAKRLIGLFTRNRDRDRGRPYDLVHHDTPSFRRIAVIGGGVMGQGIAAHLLSQGKEVRVVDPIPAALAKAKKGIEAQVSVKGSRGKGDPTEAQRALSRLTLASDYTALGSFDLVIEAAPEKLAIKREIFAHLKGSVRKDAVVVTNTSSLALAEMAADVPDAALFAGLHFFNPAPKMPLVEIVRAPGTAETTLVRLVRFCRDIGKTPVIVADSPAFAVNRILAPYLAEAMKLAEDGASPATVDRAMRGFGLPMGPFELMDTVGLDVIQDVSRYLASIPRLGFAFPPLLARMVAAGALGRKTDKGFYAYHPGRRPQRRNFDELCRRAQTSKTRPVAVQDPEQIERRLSSALIREGRRALDEKITQTADDLDLASIYGMGFPAWTGGIATWIKSLEGRETKA